MLLIKRVLRAALGLSVFAFGEYLTIRANIGLSPWVCLSMGASIHLPLSYGVTHTCISLLLLVLDLCLKERIGFGTIIDALLVGNAVDLFTWLNIVPMHHSLLPGVLLILLGLPIMAYGQYLYMSAGLGCGPRDALLVALTKRLPRLPISVVETLMLGAALLIGWLLGAPVGVGTVIPAFGMGFAMQFVFRAAKFDPKLITHESVFETLRHVAAAHRPA